MFLEHSTTKDCVWLQGMKNSDRLKSRNTRNMGKHCMAPPVGLKSERPTKHNSHDKSASNIPPSSKGANKRCYICGQSGHLAKNCRANGGEQESRGSATHKKDSNKRMLDRLQLSPITTNMMPMTTVWIHYPYCTLTLRVQWIL